MENKTVLVVEDDDHLRARLSLSLEKLGYNVLAAEDGAAALRMVPDADLVVLDLFLPKVSGEQFLKTIRKDGNFVPVVVISGIYDREDSLKRFKEYGIVDFVTKPFSNLDLMRKVSEAAAISDDLQFIPKATDKLKGFIDRQSRT